MSRDTRSLAIVVAAETLASGPMWAVTLMLAGTTVRVIWSTVTPESVAASAVLKAS